MPSIQNSMQHYCSGSHGNVVTWGSTGNRTEQDNGPVRLLTLQPTTTTLTNDDETGIFRTGWDGGEWRNWILRGFVQPGFDGSAVWNNYAEPHFELRIVGCDEAGNEVTELAAMAIESYRGWYVKRLCNYSAYGSGLGNRYEPMPVAGIKIKTRRLEYDAGSWVPSTAYDATVTLPNPWHLLFDRADLYWVSGLCYSYPGNIEGPPTDWPTDGLNVSGAYASGFLYGWPPIPPANQTTIWASQQRHWNWWEIFEQTGSESFKTINSGTSTVVRGHCEGYGTPVADWYGPAYDPVGDTIPNPHVSGSLWEFRMRAW